MATNMIKGFSCGGYTGIQGLPPVDSDLEPHKIAYNYFSKNTGHRHNPFGPCSENTEEWCINGHFLTEEQIKIAKKILADVTLAPLYLNDPILSYAARWVLKYGQTGRY